VSGEVTQEHTRLLRMGLAEPESREYWRHSGRQLDPTQLIQIAFEERWFGSRAMARVQYLIQNFRARFDAYPSALKTLHRWNSEDLAERRLLCHWHLQLSDPIYRSFTSTHLLERLHHPQPTLDRNAALRWVEGHGQGRWAAATARRMVSGLVGSAREAGFIEKTAALAPLSLPRVSDRALAYMLYLLRETDYQGSLSQNPYLGSVGLSGADLEVRLHRVPGLQFRKMSDVRDLHWDYANLWEWAQAVL
jgi:hypothetical protein